MTLLKSDLVKKLSNEFDLSKRQSTKIVNYLIDSINKGLVDHEKVELRGLGTFHVFNQKGKTLKDLKTKKTKKVESYNVVKFRASQTLKDKLN